jgi:hypothetical protein
MRTLIEMKYIYFFQSLFILIFLSCIFSALIDLNWWYFFSTVLDFWEEKDIYGFLVKNLDADSNFYNLKIKMKIKTIFCQNQFHRGRFTPKAKKKFWNKNYFCPSHEHHLSMDHISGNTSPIWSIEVPIDREYPHKETVRVCR